jgi:hypothetical protein
MVTRYFTGSADYAMLNDIDVWLGGAHLTNDTLWRWDEQSASLERQQGHQNGH